MSAVTAPSGKPAITPNDLLSQIEAAKSRSDQIENEIEGAEAKAAAANLRQMGVDRSMLSRTIIGTYAVAVIAALLFIFTVTWMIAYGKCLDLTDPKCVDIVAAWKTQIELVQDLIVTAVLPIVTLMLGFYFGTETSRSRNNDE